MLCTSGLCEVWTGDAVIYSLGLYGVSEKGTACTVSVHLFAEKTGTLLTSVNRWSVSRENFVIHIQIGRDQSVSVSVSNVVIGCEQKAWKHFRLSRSTFRNEFMQQCF